MKNKDKLGYIESDRLHLSGEKKHKSPVGGFFTICLLFILIGLTTWKGLQLFQFDGTHEYEGSLSADEEIFMNTTTMKYMFWLTDLYQYFDFDPSKMHVHIWHALYEHDQEGKETRKDAFFHLRKCNSSDFSNT